MSLLCPSQKYLQELTILYQGFQKRQEIEIPQWFFGANQNRAKKCADGCAELAVLILLVCSSKIYREVSFSCIFFQSCYLI